MIDKTAEEITENFLMHLDSGDYIINEEANLHEKVIQSKTGYVPIKGNLMSALAEYTEKTNDLFASESESQEMITLVNHPIAIRCAILIRKARLENMIIENPSFKTQLEKKNQEIERLRELNSKLANKVGHLEKQVEAFHETLSHFGELKQKEERDNEL